MNPERRHQIEQLYHLALDHEPKTRDAFLDEACGADTDLRRQVDSLLTRTLASVEPEPRARQEFEHWLDLTPGQRLGPYEVVGPLGAGGMGRVYRGIDTRLGRMVAIKTSAQEFSNRFEREARAISALNHPHICTLYDIGSLPSGAGYLVTEFVDGETLGDWLNHSPAAVRRLEVARQILEALRAAHAAGIVHRDLKPANIMVRFDGYVKVLDFGLAKRVHGANRLPAEDTATLSASLPGQMVGTVAYMSPEQIEGGEIDVRSDLFAFGIVLYEMVTGRHPWPGKSTLEILFAILHNEPPPVEHVLGGVLQKLL